ncbi:MAG: hypothetical protein LBR67_06195 [Dysgonamonadaceae bacterium]|jgi:hypothetical protein|nr:hypothetical protein [Dysgonamonadaceae bacterium]
MIKAFILLIICILSIYIKAQTADISGYIQTEFQYGQRDATLNVGNANEDERDGFYRFGVRCGRVKATFESDKSLSAVFQADMTEKGIALKDVYLSVKPDFCHIVEFKSGVMKRIFGREIPLSSSVRESPERAAVWRKMFPDERDLGVAVMFQPLAKYLKVETGLYAGNGIKPQTSDRMDFAARLSGEFYGASYYHSAFARCDYFGIDLTARFSSALGTTRATGESIYSKSSAGQDFDGGYITLVQEWASVPLTSVLKYDWADNQTFGFGLLWSYRPDVKLTV